MLPHATLWNTRHLTKTTPGYKRLWFGTRRTSFLALVNLKSQRATESLCVHCWCEPGTPVPGFDSVEGEKVPQLSEQHHEGRRPGQVCCTWVMEIDHAQLVLANAALIHPCRRDIAVAARTRATVFISATSMDMRYYTVRRDRAWPGAWVGCWLCMPCNAPRPHHVPPPPLLPRPTAGAPHTAAEWEGTRPLAAILQSLTTISLLAAHSWWRSQLTLTRALAPHAKPCLARCR